MAFSRVFRMFWDVLRGTENRSILVAALWTADVICAVLKRVKTAARERKERELIEPSHPPMNLGRGSRVTSASPVAGNIGRRSNHAKTF